MRGYVALCFTLHRSSQIALGSLSAIEPPLGGNFAKMTFADSSDAKHSASFVRTIPPNRDQAQVSTYPRNVK